MDMKEGLPCVRENQAIFDLWYRMGLPMEYQWRGGEWKSLIVYDPYVESLTLEHNRTCRIRVAPND